MLKSNDPWAAIYLAQVVKKKIMTFEDENLPVFCKKNRTLSIIPAYLLKFTTVDRKSSQRIFE